MNELDYCIYCDDGKMKVSEFWNEGDTLYVTFACDTCEGEVTLETKLTKE